MGYGVSGNGMVFGVPPRPSAGSFSGTPWANVSNKNRLFASGAGNPNVTPQQQQSNLQGMQNGTFNFQSTLGGTQQPTRTPAPGMPMGYQQQGQQQGSQPQYGDLQIQTAIQPKPIYSPQLTQQAMSRIGATNRQQGNLLYNMKQFDRPGVSRSAGTMAAALPGAVGGQVAADSGMANQFLDDRVANEQNMLMGQIARDREGLGLGNLFARMREGDHRQYMSNLNNTSGLLARMLG